MHIRILMIPYPFDFVVSDGGGGGGGGGGGRMASSNLTSKTLSAEKNREMFKYCKVNLCK